MSPAGRIVVLLCSALLLGAACGDDATRPLRLGSGTAGRIEGRIITPSGLAGGGKVTATSVGTPREQEVTASTWTDSSGVYSLPLPFGQYVLQGNLPSGRHLYYTASSSALSGPGDTLTLRPGRETVQADFPLGAAEIIIAVPPILDGMHISLYLTSRSPRLLFGGNESLCSGGEARVSFPGLAAGSYEMRLGTPWLETLVAGESGFQPDGGTAPGDTLLVQVTVGRLETIRVRLTEPATLHGTIEGAGNGLASFGDLIGNIPYLCARSADATSNLIALVALERDESYRLPIFGHAPGQVLLTYACASAEQWIGGATAAEATPVDLTPGGEIEIPPLSVDWIVLGVAGAEPWTRFPFAVTVCDLQGRRLTWGQFGHSAYNSNLFITSVLGNQSVYVHVEPEIYGCQTGWISTWYPGVDSIGQAHAVSLHGGDVIELETSLVLGGIIEGTIHSSVHEQVPPYLLLCAATDTAMTICSFSTSEGEPEFRFQGLTDGPYLLRGRFFRHNMVIWRWYPGSTRASDADTLRIRDHSVLGEVDWQAP